MNAALFDLDGTLVASKAIEHIRTSGRYDLLSDVELEKTSVYPKARRVLEALREKKVTLGLVSNAGRPYVEAILKYHHLADYFATVVTYTDVGREGAKPNPRGLLKALAEIGVMPSPGVIYVGDQDLDIEAAYAANLTPIVPSWATRTPVSLAPAFEACSSTLINYFESPNEYALFAERTAAAQSAKVTRKAVYFLPLDASADVVTFRPQLRTFALGRYFSQKSTVTVRLHDAHALSKAISEKTKVEDYRFPDYIVDTVAHVISKAGAFVFQAGEDFDIITVIPSKTKPGRMEDLLDRVRQSPQFLNSNMQFIPDVFRFSDGAVDQKTLSRTARRASVEAHLHLKTSNVADQRILILDDVITSGATMRRGLELLERANSKAAYGIALAKTVSLQEEVLCPQCGAATIIRTNSNDGSRFRGCTRYNSPNNPCKFTETISAGALRPCPDCGSAMRIRVNRVNKTKFWGCTMYPTCRHKENA